jgi:phage baseplate assembly protein V
MMKIGVVTGCEPASCRVRVRLDDHDDVVSYWLPVMQGKTLRDKQYWMPDIDEHVVCLMDEHNEFGVVLGAIYSAPDPVPVASQDKYHVRFDDSATVEYDRKEHVLSVYTPGRITVRADGDIFVDSGADIRVRAAGDVDAEAGDDLRAVAGGNAEVRAGGDLRAGAARNVEIRGAGFAQVIHAGKILIKSGAGLTLKGPRRTVRL